MLDIGIKKISPLRLSEIMNETTQINTIEVKNYLENLGLDAIPPEWFLALAGFALGAFLTAFIFILARQKLIAKNIEMKVLLEAQQVAFDQAGEFLDKRFRVTAQDALTNNNEQFLQLAQEKLKSAQADGSYDLEKRQKAIADLLTPVQENLKALSGAIEQVKGTDRELREDMKNLSRETARLVGALRDPAAQGLWGEYILEGLLQKSGLIKGVHYETQVTLTTETGKQRPDAIIRMQDGFSIIVDSKAPINQFVQRLAEEMSEEETKAVTLNLAKQVREHVKNLGNKGYWENIESPDFTVMFLPSEHIYSMALRSDPTLVDFAAERDIIIASPTLLMSLLRVVGLGWRQVQLAQNAYEISERGLDLYKRLLVFTGHIEKVGKGIQGAMKSYNDAVGSLERNVLPAARKFRELNRQNSGNDLPVFEPQEDNVRILSLASEDYQEKASQELQKNEDRFRA